MILYTPELKALFAKYAKNSPRGSPVIPINYCSEAHRLLKSFGLPVSDTVASFQIKERDTRWDDRDRNRSWTASYVFIEEGTLNGCEQYPTCVREIASYNLMMNTLTIQCHDDNPEIGRWHWKGYLTGL